jgi:hypothetical protein
MRFFQRLTARACLSAVVLSGCLALAQQTLTVAKLVDFIKSSIQLKNPDKDVAAIVAKTKLTQKLDPGIVEDLQAAGAGPRTVTALQSLVTQSASLAPPPPKVEAAAPKPLGPPEPSPEEQKRVIEEARDYALTFTKSLPNFLCLQVTRRSVDMHFQPDTEGAWTPEDQIVERLAFLDQKEKYDLIQRNDTALVGKTWEALGGSFSRGEWASLLGQIFEPSSHTEFRWLRWGTLRKQLVHVYQFRVAQEYSQETIDYRGVQKITAGYRGMVWIQKGSNVVLRVSIHPEIPPDFPVQDVDQTLDYDYQEIAGQQYLVPLRSQVQMRDGRIASRNEIEWRKYQRYSADTVIKFEDADAAPLSDDKTKEQPPPKQ